VTVAAGATLPPAVGCGFTVSVALAVLDPYETEIVTTVVAATDFVLTVKLPEVEP